MREFARKLYQSRAWKDTRAAYYRSRLGLCERCGQAGDIVHHKKHLTHGNVGDPSVSLAWSNLEVVCRRCHALEHEGGAVVARGMAFDEDGNLVEQVAPGPGIAGATGSDI